MAHLKIEERDKIYEMHEAGYSSRSIGQAIGRDKSTVCYELRKIKGKYRPDKAHRISMERRLGKKTSKLDANSTMRREIIDDLQRGYAPDIISIRRRNNDKQLNISTESIYKFIYESPFAQKEHLNLLLARKRKSRLSHGSRIKQRKGKIPGRVSINEREVINRREAQIGNFEGDLTFNIGDQSRNIGALVDMRTQKIFLTLNSSKRSSEVITNMNKKMKKVAHIVKTITFDNGKEFTYHQLLLANSKRKIYFCDPYSPWQKPLVEKMNSMIHRLYPKTRNIENLTKKGLREIEDFLNNLPRRILGYKTPNQAWNENINLA